MEISEEQIKLIKNQNPNANKGEIDLFLHQVRRTSLDPLNRQIYLLNVGGGKHQAVISVDGFRLIAQRSGEYAGQAGPFFCGEDGKWVDVWLNKFPPRACRVGVLRQGFRDYLYAIANWEAYSRNSSVWKKMPSLMLAKVAECLALRRAFPQELSGLYSAEEMDQTQHEEPKKEEPKKEEPKKSIDNYGDPKVRFELVNEIKEYLKSLTAGMDDNGKINYLRNMLGVSSFKSFDSFTIEKLRDAKNLLASKKTNQSKKTKNAKNNSFKIE